MYQVKNVKIQLCRRNFGKDIEKEMILLSKIFFVDSLSHVLTAKNVVIQINLLIPSFQFHFQR